MQPERIREPNPDAEDEAYDAARQREVDEETEREMEAKRRASGYSPEQLLAERPKPQPCHQCDQPHAAVICPFCKTPRPAYALLKKLTNERNS